MSYLLYCLTLLVIAGFLLADVPGAAAQAVLPATIEVPYPPGEENLHPHHVFRQPGTDRVLRLAFSTPGRDDTLPGAKTYKMWYQVSQDGGRTYDTLRPLIQQGSEFDRMHPIRPVYVGKNSYVASIPPPSLASNGEVLVPFWFWPLDENGKLRHEADTWTFTAAGILIGTWAEDGSDIAWDLGQTVHLSFAQSRRGAMEPAIVELKQPGHFLMIMRASNLGDDQMPSYKWKAVSTDYCRTWSEPTPFTYTDGEPFFSPSASSDIRRHSRTGKLYWFGNITPENAQGNSPRYPLIFGEVDEQTLGLIKDSVKVIDTYDPEKGDTPEVQFSNFGVAEDPKTGAFIVTLPRIDTGRVKVEHSADVSWPRERYVVAVE